MRHEACDPTYLRAMLSLSSRTPLPFIDLDQHPAPAFLQQLLCISPIAGCSDVCTGDSGRGAHNPKGQRRCKVTRRGSCRSYSTAHQAVFCASRRCTCIFSGLHSLCGCVHPSQHGINACWQFFWGRQPHLLNKFFPSAPPLSLI